MATTKRRKSSKDTVATDQIQINDVPMSTPPVVETEVVNVSPQWHPIDWQKVKTIEDIKVILENMGLGCYENAPAYNVLKKFI